MLIFDSKRFSMTEKITDDTIFNREKPILFGISIFDTLETFSSWHSKVLLALNRAFKILLCALRRCAGNKKMWLMADKIGPRERHLMLWCCRDLRRCMNGHVTGFPLSSYLHPFRIVATQECFLPLLLFLSGSYTSIPSTRLCVVSRRVLSFPPPPSAPPHFLFYLLFSLLLNMIFSYCKVKERRGSKEVERVRQLVRRSRDILIRLSISCLSFMFHIAAWDTRESDAFSVEMQITHDASL